MTFKMQKNSKKGLEKTPMDEDRGTTTGHLTRQAISAC